MPPGTGTGPGQLCNSSAGGFQPENISSEGRKIFLSWLPLSPRGLRVVMAFFVLFGDREHGDPGAEAVVVGVLLVISRTVRIL